MGGFDTCCILLLPRAVFLLSVVARACDPFSLPHCDEIKVIGAATGRDVCEYKRDYYRCLKSEECYDLEFGCRDDENEPASCRELCEAEPEFAYCVDEEERPDEDYHLCPHVPKADFRRPPPTDEQLATAIVLPFTAVAWTAFDVTEESLSVASILPSLWPDAVKTALAQAFDLYPAEVIVQEPVGYRAYALGLESGPVLPGWVEDSTFFSLEVLIVDHDALDATREQLNQGMAGDTATLIDEIEQGLRAALRSSMPAAAGLEVSQLAFYAQSGSTDVLPEMTSTTLLTTSTTTLDASLVVQLWQAWRLRCLEPVVYRWEVFELQLWADACPQYGGKLLLHPGSVYGGGGDANSTLTAISSGSFTENMTAKAFDGVKTGTDTAWISSCQGCRPGEAWLGLDAGASVPFTAACAIVRQTPSPTGQCSRMALEATDNVFDTSSWQLRDIATGFEVEQTICIRRTTQDYPMLECGGLDDGCAGTIDFGTCAGYNEECRQNRCSCIARAELTDDRFRNWECGTFDDGCDGQLDFGNCSDIPGGARCENHHCIEDEPAAVQWRLVCESGTVGRWWVKELEFHTEGLCYSAFRAFRRSIASGSAQVDFPPINAFDEDESTLWGSQCSRCEPRAAWLGVDFGQQVKVACVKLIQMDGALQQCERMVLEYSDDGTVWHERYRYGFGDHTLLKTSILRANIDVDVDDRNLLPSQRYAPIWRLVCLAAVTRPWGVFELDFFDDRACRRPLRAGITRKLFSTSGAWPAENAFDNRLESVWRSKCGRCLADGSSCVPCKVGEAFIGAEFARAVMVNCIRIHQLEKDKGACPNIALQFTEDESEWITRDNFVGTGAFEYLIPFEGPPREDDMSKAQCIDVRRELWWLLAVSWIARSWLERGL